MKTSLFTLSLLWSVLAFAQPYEPVAIWQREGAGDSSLYGSEILALGDQNDDGFNDWAVYAAGLGYAPPGSPNEPRVEFFHGGLTPDTIPYMVRIKDPAMEVAIPGAEVVGDLNGDGYIDWFIVTAYIDNPEQRYIYKIYYGGPGSHEDPNLILTSGELAHYFPVGDFNGDQFDDLYLWDSDNETVDIFFGGNPMDTLPDWHRTADLAPDHPGDVNGDGFGDIACYNNNTGYTHIYLGASQPDTVPADSFPSISLDIIRDLNGDGFDDLCFRGNGWGGLSWGGSDLDMVAEAQLTFPCGGAGPLPLHILSAGDFNHDGFNDVVMLRESCSNSLYGILTVHLGHPWIYSEPAFVIYGWTDPFNLIRFRAAANLGDINGDNIDDLGIGANGNIWGPEYEAYRGKAVILGGDDSLIADAPEAPLPLPLSLGVAVYPNPFNNSTTFEITAPAYAKDVDLAIVNLIGQDVYSTKIPVNSGKIIYRYDVVNLPTGLFFLRVTSGHLQITTKLMVLK